MSPRPAPGRVDVDGSYACSAARFSLGFFGPVLDLPLVAA